MPRERDINGSVDLFRLVVLIHLGSMLQLCITQILPGSVVRSVGRTRASENGRITSSHHPHHYHLRIDLDLHPRPHCPHSSRQLHLYSSLASAALPYRYHSQKACHICSRYDVEVVGMEAPMGSLQHRIGSILRKRQLMLAERRGRGGWRKTTW